MYNSEILQGVSTVLVSGCDIIIEEGIHKHLANLGTYILLSFFFLCSVLSIFFFFFNNIQLGYRQSWLEIVKKEGQLKLKNRIILKKKKMKWQAFKCL